ncbi:MAG TPA: outer-membrane lipoprotein carrier protein LolA [Pyrinomonadaceae bacterium]|jgi:outer membrane lipoprotein-sorting protein|nr:outer-membrane lipoprotein carrier protein LolA [Pyrinomonadaceae bacterium]
MKKYFSFALVAMLLASTAFVSRPAQAQGPGLVSSILNKMERNRRELHSLRAEMTMQKWNAQIHEEEMSYGQVQYVAGKGRDANVRVDWTRPARELLAVSNGKYTLYRPRLNQAIVGTTANARGNAKVNGVLGFGLNASGAQLKSQYNIELAGEGTLYDGGPHVVYLKLTPKTASGKFTEVWVDDSGMPVQTRVTESNGDTTLVRLTNIERNASIPSDAFDPKLPSGVKIVKS